MANNKTDAAWDSAIYNADRARNCELLVEMMKVKMTVLRIELRDALGMAYGHDSNWPKSAVSALSDLES